MVFSYLYLAVIFGRDFVTGVTIVIIFGSDFVTEVTIVIIFGSDL